MVVISKKIEKTIIAIISFGFVVWSAIFIFRSSFIAIDDTRYFCLFDDAMISMRYGWNFAHGFGLVWNPGEYIEGFTNLLMTLLMSFVTLIFDKSTSPLVIQIFGAGFMLGIAYLSTQIADHINWEDNCQNKGLLKIILFFSILSYYPLLYWSLMGMETGLLSLLLLLAVRSTFNFSRTNNFASLRLVAFYLGLAFLTRNDSIICGFLIWTYIFWDLYIKKIDRKYFGKLLVIIGLFSLFVIGQQLFRHLYYSELLPNTYTLKLTGLPLLDRIENGVGFISSFLINTSIVLVVSCISLFFYFRKSKLLLISIVFSTICYQVYVGGDPWNYWRIMSPAMPLAILLFINTINVIIHKISSIYFSSDFYLQHAIFSRKYISVTILIFFTWIGLLAANIGFLGELSFFRKPYQVEDNRRNVNTAIALRQLTTTKATIGVFWAGSIPFYTGRRAYDFLGKSDRYIANLLPDDSGNVSWNGMNSVPGHNKYDLEYSIMNLEPTYVERFQWGSQDISQWAATRYVRVDYNGVVIYLLKKSPEVLWNKINPK